MIGHLYTVVIDCPDPDELAGFYEKRPTTPLR
jgi:hypothetical protein